MGTTGSVILSIVAMLVMLSILTVVHEFGHYLMARIFKVKINEFSVFMGPKIFSHVSKKTGIKYSLRWLPIGGYCAFEGEEEYKGPDSFYAQPWYKRACILFAGAFMNIILALITITVIFMINGYSTTRISDVKTGFAAEFTNMQVGDKVIKYDGHYLFSPDDYSIFHEYDKDNEMEITVRRQSGGRDVYIFKTESSRSEDETVTYFNVDVYRMENDERVLAGHFKGTQTAENMIFNMEYADGHVKEYNYSFVINEETKWVNDCSLVLTEYDSHGNVVSTETSQVSDYDGTVRLVSLTKYGFSFTPVEKGNFFGSLWNGFTYCISMVRSIYYSIYWMITGTVGLNSVMGPVGLTAVVSDVVGANADVGSKILVLVNMMALISVNLGVFNLLPFPALDGGKLFLIIIELIRKGKRISSEKEGLISLVGFAVLILLAVLIAGKDIVELIKG